MTLSEVTFIRKNKNLERMFQDVTSIYNKTLYYLRQAYFEGLKSGEQIKLHAQCRITDFYNKSGYTAFGEVEDIESCPHIWMRKNL